MSVQPDVAQLRAGVMTEAKTARDAADANAKMMATVMAAIQALGIEPRDVQTSRYQIIPIFDSNRPVRDRVTGYQAANSVLLKIRQIDRVGEIIDKLAAAGANSMGGVEFTVADPSKALDQARKEAIADARRRAEIYASAAGATLGRAFSIVEQSTTAPQPFPAYMRAAAAPAAETPIAPGERTLRVSVMVNFDLKR